LKVTQTNSATVTKDNPPISKDIVHAQVAFGKPGAGRKLGGKARLGNRSKAVGQRKATAWRGWGRDAVVKGSGMEKGVWSASKTWADRTLDKWAFPGGAQIAGRQVGD
jgi:hypothetical protein